MKQIYAVTLLLLTLTGPLFGQEVKWSFPVVPGSDAWNKLENVNARVAVCQIPTDVIKKLSTASLVQLCAEHPFFLSYGFSNSPIDGFRGSMESFNGYQELLLRPDALKTVASYYSAISFGDLDKLQEDSQKGNFSLRIVGVEMMMSNEKLIAACSDADKTNILKMVNSVHEKKAAYGEIFGGFGEVGTAYLAVKLMKNMPSRVYNESKYSANPNWKSFQNNMIPFDKELVDQVVRDFREAVVLLK